MVLTSGSRLPTRCVKCNAPASPQFVWRKRLYLYHWALALLISTGASAYILAASLYRYHWALALHITLNVIIFGMAALITRGKATVEVALCEIHGRKRRKRIFIAWMIVLAGIISVIGEFVAEVVMVIAAIAAFDAGSGEGDAAGTIAITCVILGTALPLTALIWAAFAVRVLSPKKIDDHYAWLKGACPEYLDSLPSMGHDLNGISSGASVPARRYSMRRDGMAWLICIAAALAWPLLQGNVLRFGDPVVAGVFVLVLPFGWAFSRILWHVTGKTSGARFGFALGAFGIVALPSIGAYAPSNSNNLRTTDAKVILDFDRNLFANVNEQNQDYQNSVAQLCGDGLFQANKLDTADKIVSARAKLARLRVLVNDFEKNRLKLLDDAPARIAALPISAESKASALSGYEQNVGKTRDFVEQLGNVDGQFVVKSEQLLDFMRSRLGTFKVTKEVPYFSSDADVSQYNAIIAQLGELITKEQQITQQSQQLAQHSLDAMEQGIFPKVVDGRDSFKRRASFHL